MSPKMMAKKRANKVRWRELDGRKLAKAKLRKQVLEWRGWAKFGGTLHDDVGARLTIDSIEEIRLQRPRPPVQMDEGVSLPDPVAVGITNLDKLVRMNLLYGVIIFIGLALTTPSNLSLDSMSSCNASADVAKRLVVYEYVSFSFYLASLLVPCVLKVLIRLLKRTGENTIVPAHIRLKVLRSGMIGSALGTFIGGVFLMLSLTDWIQLSLGILSTLLAMALTLITSALVVFITTATHTILHHV